MATPVIYQGDDTDFLGAAALSINLSTGFDLDGCTVSLLFCDCRREFNDLTGRSAVLPLTFSAEETGRMTVGTHKATIRVTDAEGRVRTARDDVRIRVTDDLREAYGGAEAQEIDVSVETGIDPSRLMDGEVLNTNTPNSMRQAVKKIAQALGATVSALAVAALPAWGASVVTAPLGELDLDQNPSVVTNVSLDGLVRWDNSSGWYSTLNLGGAWLQWPGFFIAPGVEGFVFGHDLQSVLVPDGSRVATSNMVEGVADAKVSGKADKADTYTKAETDAKIVELSPPADLTPATNYTGFALGRFADTGTVARASTYGTPTRWTDATGCVWEVVTDAWIDHETGNIFRNGISIFPSEVTDGEMRGYLTYDSNAMGYLGLEGEGWYYNGENTSGSPSTVFHGGQDATSLDNGRFTFGFTNLVGRVALTNDLSGGVSEATVTNIAEAVVRAKSLGGIYDSKLGIWWTPGMADGALHYYATTNVNLNVEDDE